MLTDTSQAVRKPARSVTGLSAQRGLTLVEMLISLVLSSIIFVSAFQVISNMVNYQVRAGVKNEMRGDRLLLDNLLSQVIEMGINQYELFFHSQKSTLFRGKQDTLQLLSRAYSGNFDQAGHRVYRLFERSGRLFVSYRAYDRNYRSNQQYELDSGLAIEDLKFSYFAQGEWLDDWSNDKAIPEFIRIRARLPGSSTVEWIRGTSRR